MQKRIPTAKFECSYCGQEFKSESRFIKHKCKWKERAEHLKTTKGKQSYMLYRAWMKKQHKYVPEQQTFMRSKYYSAFTKFVDFVTTRRIASVQQYMDLMNIYKLDPIHWTSDQAYVNYMKHVDTVANPLKQVEISIDMVLKLADILQCEPGEIFDHLHPQEVIDLIQVRKLSPWLLLNSTKFKQFVVSCNKEQQYILTTLINPSFWKKKFNENLSINNKIKLFVEELKL